MWHEGDRSDLTSDILSQTDAYFYWFRFSEFNNKDEPVNFYCVKDIDGANICIVKSDLMRVRLAMTKNGTLWLHDGTNRVDSISYEVSKYGHLVPQPFCKNDRIFVGTFIAAILNCALTIYFSRNFRGYYWGENDQQKVIRGGICLRYECFQRNQSLRGRYPRQSILLYLGTSNKPARKAFCQIQRQRNDWSVVTDGKYGNNE
jgi:hypothetical protein